MSEHAEILTAATHGDDAALAALVRVYHDRVYRFGLQICRDGFDADDAVQEAFIKLSRRPEVMRDRGALSWLMTVVRHACLRLLRPFARQRRALGERDGDHALDPGLDAESALERWQLVQSVHAGIAALPRASREVLILRDLEGLSGDETCQALGLDSSTMKSRLHRARTQLRAELLRGEAVHVRR